MFSDFIGKIWDLVVLGPMGQSFVSKLYVEVLTKISAYGWSLRDLLIEAKWCIYASVTYATIDSDNDLSPIWCKAIISTNTGILLIGPFGTNFSEIFIKIYTFSFKKMHLKLSSGNWRPFCLCLNVLNAHSAILGVFLVHWAVYLM